MVVRGARCNLYKKYTSNLAIVATNYAQSDLRQFELEYAYYYTDTANKILKKIKLNLHSIKTEFSSVKAINSLLPKDDFGQNPENCLKTFFKHLNLIKE